MKTNNWGGNVGLDTHNVNVEMRNQFFVFRGCGVFHPAGAGQVAKIFIPKGSWGLGGNKMCKIV